MISREGVEDGGGVEVEEKVKLEKEEKEDIKSNE